MKTLLSVLLTVLLLVPATVMAADDYAAITNLNIAAVDTDASVIELDYDVQNTGATDVGVTILVTGDDVDTVTHTVTLDKNTINEIPASIRIPVSGTLTAGIHSVEVTITESVADTLDKGAQAATAMSFTVNAATPASNVPLAETSGLITNVDIEEDELTYGDEIEFEIELETTGSQRISNMIVEVEFDDETIETREFKMFGDSEDTVEVTLTQSNFKTVLDIPSDVDEIDEATYPMTVRVYGLIEQDSKGNDEGSELNRYHLLDEEIVIGAIEVEKLDDNLAIEGVNFEQQGNVLYTAILVENIGSNNEEDVRARIQIADLDINQMSNRITVYEGDDATVYVPVVLPSFATGEYNVKITVYNDEVSVSRTAEDVELAGIVGPQTSANLVIGVDTAIKTVSENGAVYAMTFTNNGNTARTFLLETAGAEWGQTSVNPATVVVGAGTSEIASVFVAPNIGEAGTRQFTVFVKEGNQIVKSVGLTANVEGNVVTGSSVVDFGDLVDSGLKWVAAILVVVLIVLFVVWSWNKVDDEEL